MKISKQDKNGVRTPTDIERRYKLGMLDELGNAEERLENLESNKVDKVTGKNLSSNDFTNAYVDKVDKNTQARHTHTKTDSAITTAVNNSHTHGNKNLIDTYTQTNEDLTSAVDNTHTHDNKTVLDSITGTSSVSLDSYLGSDFTLLRGTCVTKNKRVCINAVVSGAIGARTTATIFDLPSSLSPVSQKDGVAFGTTSSGSTCGWYNISTSGVVSVWFPEAVTTYTRVNIVYDIEY